MVGKIITLEGLDGSGKSTQIKLLLNRFKEMDIEYKYIHFPMLDKGIYGKVIAEYLRGDFGSLYDIHPKLISLLFAEDRNEYKQTMYQWVNDGYLVLLDRYVNSNIAYQCAKLTKSEDKKKLKDWILDFEYNINKIPKPNLSLFLNTPLDYIESNLINNREGNDRLYLNGNKDIHESSIDFQRNVYNEYVNLISEQPDFLDIKCKSESNDWLDANTINDIIFNKIVK
jgi:dTMP kinase